MRSGATSSRQPRRRLAAVGLVLLAGIAAGGAVLVVQRIERDLDRRIGRSLRDAGLGEVAVPVRVQDGVYRTQTLGLWLAGLAAAAIVGLVLGLLVGRVRRRPVDPDDAALLRQGWRVEEPGNESILPPLLADEPATAAPLAAVEVPVPPVPAPEPAVASPVAGAERHPVAAEMPFADVGFEVAPLVDPALSAAPAPARRVGPDPRVPARSRSRSAVVPPPARDDLTAVSGIDHDVAALLRANGIGTWERLGVAEVGELRRLLDLEGPRFHACQPGTWPIQGRLLAAGEWSAWRSLVDGLRDGRPIWR